MKRCFFILLFFLSYATNAQKVGLVLSGGGAKGIAHIGVLKALEENEIPIDYIVGTSMGGIIGGCYSAGMSPTQIEHMVLSSEFLGWINGSSEQGFNYFYYKNDITPTFLKLTLDVDSTLNFQFNTSLAKDVSLNFALADRMAQASAISHNNFDSLFVPLRVIAADIFTQNEVVLSKGSLSDALRATQTVPFFYTPIRVDGKYLFDGGVYNNFPVDIAERDFKPDVIIGVNVSTKIFEEYPYDNDDKLISRSLLFMLMDKSDPSMIHESGIFIQPNLKGFTSFDFARAESLIDSGYTQTIKQIEELKRKIARRATCDEVAERRNAFNNKSVPLVFDGLTFKGFNSSQRAYIRRLFKTHPEDNKPLYYNSIKKGYFKLVAEDYFSNVYPGILYDSSKKKFAFQLSRRPQQNFQVDFGGVIASRDISNIFLGLNYYHFGRTLKHYYTAFQTGSFYKSGIAEVRIDYPNQLYLEPFLEYNNWNYLENGDLFKEVTSSMPTVLSRINRKYGIHIGMPIRESFKCVVGIEGFNDIDRYINGDVFISTDTLDILRTKGFKTGFSFSANNLNRKQYASSGKAYSISGDYFHVTTSYTPGNTSVLSQPMKTNHEWFRVRACAEQYFDAGWFHTGYIAEAVFSNQPFFQNYFGTIINTPAFLPLQDSRTLILENFRSFNYLAGGIRNIFTLRTRLDFRLEGYLFKPFDYIKQGSNQEAYISRDIESLFFAGSAAFVYHAPIGPVSLSVNYYDDDQNQLGVLLHVGFLLYNKHSLE
ncbi:patatin-like phospholipase family protein [Ohtaekwangia koreensis]|uniref:NTE family protein n=1 Tax=Ohtaekwangia koreensis TaxID=688867 RepID=A0A1T5LIT2_9BACT|nr:patatin-like phospholipase family protein [Ohtaekwangia koreensis]SKC75328.1 NTE family protein [Ohtaekwangia koreensis]